jgi:hypothetical protein
MTSLCCVVLALADAHAQQWNVVEAGARADGEADCTDVFQRLLDEAGRAGGGTVAVPAGRFRIERHLSVPANVTLQGIFRMPPTRGNAPASQLTGSVLLAREGRGSDKGEPFLRLAGNHATVAGLIIAYPDWKQTDVPPVPYPPCIESRDTENVGVHDCLLLNPFEGIRLVRAHRHLVRNVTGYPIQRGIYVDECYDIGRIENIHFWPFGVNYQAENPYCRWINTQGVAIELARTDWHYVLNTFCFGYGIGYKFSESKRGSANGNFLGLGADSCQRAVVVEQAQAPGLLITNGEFVGRWSSGDAVCVEVAPQVKGKVSLVNCSFWGPIDRCVWMRSPAGQFTASACHFVQWDVRREGSPALQIDAGKAIVQGCTFEQDDLHIEVRPEVRSAIITANQAPGGLCVENQAGSQVQIALNEGSVVSWTAAARAHYRLDMGQEGDSRYLRRWHAAERPKRPFRWSSGASVLRLPVNAGETYELTLETHLPPLAATPEAGVYLENQRLATLVEGATVVPLPAVTHDELSLELRSGVWVPRDVEPGSQDQRSLGIQLFSVTMRSSKAAARVFRANDGQWRNDGDGRGAHP